jgi:sulfonate transport system permease protein
MSLSMFAIRLPNEAASILGIGLGALIGSSRGVMEFLQPLVEFLQPVPASAIIPAEILLFGLSNEMALFVISFGSILERE